MKVIHILNELKFSGAEIMYVDVAPIFQQLGCELSVVNTALTLGEYTPYFEKAGYIVFHKIYPKGYMKKWVYYFQMIKFLKKNNYDIVHTHRNDLKWGMSFCAWIAGCKSVHTFHSVFKSKNRFTYYCQTGIRCSAKKIFHCTLQTISDSVYEHEKNYYHNETIKVYNWYGKNRFYPAVKNEKYDIRKELNINQDSLVLISIGGCSHTKRHTDIIKALPAIVEKYPDVVYLHLGDGYLLPEEQTLAEELQVSEHILFCGNQKKVRKYLIASDIYLMTSIHEGISLTTIEAMACKIPAILYDVPGLRDFNREKECALIIQEDFKVLAESIIFLYENKDKQKVLIDNAIRFIITHFDMHINATKIFNLYQAS